MSAGKLLVASGASTSGTGGNSHIDAGSSDGGTGGYIAIKMGRITPVMLGI